MSKYVDEIIEGLKEYPELFEDIDGSGVKRGEVSVKRYGNTALFSVINVCVNGIIMPTTYMDKYKLERKIKNWYRTIPLSRLLSSNKDYKSPLSSPCVQRLHNKTMTDGLAGLSGGHNKDFKHANNDQSN